MDAETVADRSRGDMPNLWMLKSTLLSDAAVTAGAPEFTIVDPGSGARLSLANMYSADAAEEFRLSSHLVFEAASIQAAKSVGEDLLRTLLAVLAFTTGCRVEVEAHTCLYDWNPACAQRAGRIYRRVADPGFPFDVLDSRMARSAERMLRVIDNRAILHATRCFANAVNSTYPSERFQWFWYCIEVVAEQIASPARVADKCQRCHSDLWCPTCNRVSKHRPFVSQKIGELFGRHADSSDDNLYRLASEFRNGMMHGGSVRELERRHSVRLANLLDGLAHVASSALFELTLPKLPNAAEQPFEVVRPSSYKPIRYTITGKVSFSLAASEALEFSKIPDINLQLFRKGSATRAEGAAHADPASENKP